MKYELHGTTMQMLNIELKEGESVTAETGRLTYMSDNVDMITEMKGGLWGAIKRKFAGESFFLVRFRCANGKGILGFGTEFPGKIIPLQLKENEEIIAQKDAFLCSEESVTFDATWTRRIGAGLLGGEGLILVKVRGPGLAFFNVGGEVTKVTLQRGQKLRIDTGSLAMFDAGMEYSVERVKGIKNIIWGGEGLFLATIEGPGRVWIQSMPVNELAAKLLEYVDTSSGGSLTAAASGLIIGNILRKSMFGER